MNNILAIIKNKNVLWNMIGITINSFFSLFLIILITRFNGVEASGQFSFVFYLSATFQQIGLFGGRIYQVSDLSNKYKSGSYIALKYFSSFLMIIISFSFCIINAYDIQKFTLFMIFMIYHIFECISEAFYGILQKHNRLDIIGKSMTYRIIISLVLFIFLNIITKNIIIASLAFIVGYAFVLYFYDTKKSKQYENVKMCFDSRVIKLMKASYKVCLFTFFNILMLNVTRYAVDINLNDEAQGYFSILIMPAALIALFAQFLVQPLVTPLSNKYHEHHFVNFAKDTSVVLIIILTFGVAASVCSYYILPTLLEIVYSLDFSNYKLEIALVIFAGICSSSTTVISTILIIMRKMNAQLISFGVSIGFNFLISFMLVKDSITNAIYCYFTGLLIQLLIFLFVYIYYIIKDIKKTKI
ncbi:MAG: hypothetical protein RR788_01730 [Erysipelotrichaceae bacterium]